MEGLLKNYKSPEDLLGQGGLLKELTKALVEKALEGELTHLGYPRLPPRVTGSTGGIKEVGKIYQQTGIDTCQRGFRQGISRENGLHRR